MKVKINVTKLIVLDFPNFYTLSFPEYLYLCVCVFVYMYIIHMQSHQYLLVYYYFIIEIQI